MKLRYDILMTLENKKFDLDVKDGDFVIGVSDLQHIANILEAEKGQFRQTPLVGVGVLKMINGPISGAEKRDIKMQLQGDGYQTKEVVFKEGLLKIRI
jgi:hypothetical protein